MKKLLVIPDRNNLDESIKLAGEYDLGFEYNDYFGKYRAGMLAMCEKEIFGSRRYLIEDFLEDFCEDEVLEFSNYSNKKLKSILDWNKEDITVNNYYNAKEFDKISKFIATIILKEKQSILPIIEKVMCCLYIVVSNYGLFELFWNFKNLFLKHLF